MDGLFQLNRNDVLPAAGVKVLSPDEVASFHVAVDVIEAARIRAVQIEADAVQKYEEEKKRGFEEGLREGKAEMADQMLENIARSVDYLEHMEATVVDLVIKSLKNILGQIPPEETILRIISRGLQHVHDQKAITLRVCDPEVDVVRGKLDDLARQIPGVGTISVVSGPGMSAGACIIETELGVVDVSLDKQLELLEKAFRNNLSGGKSK